MRIVHYASIVVAALIGLGMLTSSTKAQTGSDSTNEVCFNGVTGGGWITNTPSGGFANFGLVGGIVTTNNILAGHLNYIDHDMRLHVVSTNITGYATDPANANCRILNFGVLINGQPGTAVVEACDNDDTGNGEAEQGPADTFTIMLSSGYTAGGTILGGTVQLHECP